MKQMTIDEFGEVVDDMLTREAVKMTIYLPAGSQDVRIQDNLGLGGSAQFYILLKAIEPIYKNIYDNILDPTKAEAFIDGILGMIKADLMEASNGRVV